jgi:hypothetical protein
MDKTEFVKQGFIKRAQEFGATIYEAEEIYKKALDDQSLNHLIEQFKHRYGPIAAGTGGAVLGGTAGLGVGGVLGGLSGLADGTQDEKGKTHRIANMFHHAGVGAGLGGSIGAIGGGLASANIANQYMNH